MKVTQLILIVIFQFMLNSQPAHTQTLYNGVGHIPAAYQLRWNKAGLLTDVRNMQPRLVIDFANLSGDDDAKMATALSQARNHIPTGGLAVIYFPEGTYDLHNTISLNATDKNIVFQGAGADKTTLIFENMKNASCFILTGNIDGWSDLLQS